MVSHRVRHDLSDLAAVADLIYVFIPRPGPGPCPGYGHKRQQGKRKAPLNSDPLLASKGLSVLIFPSRSQPQPPPEHSLWSMQWGKEVPEQQDTQENLLGSPARPALVSQSFL